MAKEEKILFGTAGVPSSTKKKSTAEGILRSKELGATAMEIEWVHGVRVSEKVIKEISEAKKEAGIELTAHAPYYINLNSPEKYKIEKSKQRIIDALNAAYKLGVKSVALHAGFNHGKSSNEVYKQIKRAIRDINKRIDKKVRDNVRLSIETMGKQSQFGSLAECISMAKEIKNVSLVLDISHLHARSRGELNTYKEFTDIFKKIKKELGAEALKEIHIHLSGIEYGPAGERKHCPLKKSTLNYKDFLKAVKKMKVEGFIICESPDPEKDLKLIMETWKKIKA